MAVQPELILAALVILLVTRVALVRLGRTLHYRHRKVQCRARKLGG